eukprot:TRINITY_DN11131_c0_g1_i1.p1 TRINITY_DN11131_c0_g1~~TRINITY_DN11131_c0_g1_i1.p1  ORF type:complete len:622 (+),score=115.77 TRINITY_DN11131_c0_g1_i1:82-1947(+)
MSLAGSESPTEMLHSLALLALLQQAMKAATIPDGAKVRVTELEGFLMGQIKDHANCPDLPRPACSRLCGSVCTVIESKGSLVRVQHAVGKIWLPRICVIHHDRDRVRVRIADPAVLKQAVQSLSSIHSSVSWQPDMEHLAGLDGDVLERKDGVVKIGFVAMGVYSLPEALVEVVPDRCIGRLHPGQKVRASKLVQLILHEHPGLQRLFGADGSKMAKVLGFDKDGDPRIAGAESIGTLQRLLVEPLLEQGTRVELSEQGRANERLREFLKPGETGLVVGFDTDGDPAVLISGPRIVCVPQDLVVKARAATDPAAEGTPPQPKRPRLGAAPGSAVAVGARVLVHPSIVTPKYSWGGISPGDVGVVCEVQGDGKRLVDFPQQSQWAAAVEELMAADFAGGQCRKCHGRLVEPKVQSSWKCDQCDRCFSADGIERWRCAGCDYDQCGICRRVPAPGESGATLCGKRVKCCDEQTLRRELDGHQKLNWHDHLAGLAGKEGTVMIDDRSDGTCRVRFDCSGAGELVAALLSGIGVWLPTSCLTAMDGDSRSAPAPPPSGAVAAGRPSVGDRVMLAPGGPTEGCLSPGDVGIVEKDMEDSQPFLVRCKYMPYWYREGEIIKAPVEAP